jgi:hypothetical protein
LPSEDVNKTKQKILDWLKEEAFSPQENADPKAYFNISVQIGNLGCNIVQDVHHNDSFFVGANLVFGANQQVLLKGMEIQKVNDFLWELEMSLIKNNELGDFQIKPKPPEDIQAVFISSKRIYYDQLTKGNLVSTISVVLRAIMMTIWMLEKHAGILTPKVSAKRDYAT